MRTRVDASEPDDSKPEQLEAWIAAGFEPSDAEIWRSWRFTIARAEAWIQQGVTEGLEAAQWMAAGVDPTTIQAWRDAGIDSSEAALWHEMGYDIDTASAEKAKGLGPVEAFTQAQAQSRSRSSSFGSSAWISRTPSVTGSQVMAGGLLRGDPRVMHGYLQRQWLDEEAQRWAAMGIEAADAYTWHALGLTPGEAGRLAIQGRGPGDVIREWWAAGIPFAEVADWIGAGLSSQEAVEQRSQGITSEQAATLRALRQQEPGPKQDSSVLSQLITPQGPPGSSIPGPPPDDESAARSAVEDAFARMLDVDEADGSIPAVEGGANLGEALLAAGQRHSIDQDPSQRSVKVDGLRFVNDHEARVVFSLTISGPFSGTPMIRGRQGRAVLVDGEWKVARDTFCALMQIAGIECPPPER
jgi:hypothetical protein